MKLKVVKMLLILFGANVISVETTGTRRAEKKHDTRNLGEHKPKFFREVLIN
jgi:hypothetical protein